jgi:hypothetical protein
MNQFPLIDGFKIGVKPPPEIPFREWASDNVYLPNSPEGARYSLDAVPAHGIIFDWLEDMDVREIALIACVGFGKTAILESWCTRIVAIDPGDTLVIGQTGDMVKQWMESRMRKIWSTSPLASPYIPTGAERSNWKKDSVIFRHMNFFAGSANETDLQEKSMVNTAGDEVWRWERDGRAGMIGYLLKRHHGRWNRKNLLMSQGGYEDGEWHQHAKGGKWHELEHICPSCGTGSEFDWRNWQYETVKDSNDEFDWPAIFDSIRLKCPHCGDEFQDTEYNRRQWAKCKPVWNGGKHVPDRMTLRATFMTVWRYAWRDIVREWILANEDKRTGQFEKLEQITNQRFAQFWKPPSDAPILTDTGDPYSKKEFNEGQKWELEDFRFMTVDNQLGHRWVVIRAWKIGGESRLIWEGKVNEWANVRYLQEKYGVENRAVFVDGRYRVEEVAEAAMQAAKPGDTRQWNILMGEESNGYMIEINKKRFLRPFSSWVSNTSTRGITYKFCKFSNLKCKDRLTYLMSSGTFGVPVDASKEYHAHMQAENKREMSPGKWRYVPVKKGRPNHMWDCETMQIAAAAIFKVLTVIEEVK